MSFARFAIIILTAVLGTIAWGEDLKAPEASQGLSTKAEETTVSTNSYHMDEGNWLVGGGLGYQMPSLDNTSARPALAARVIYGHDQKIGYGGFFTYSSKNETTDDGKMKAALMGIGGEFRYSMFDFYEGLSVGAIVGLTRVTYQINSTTLGGSMSASLITLGPKVSYSYKYDSNIFIGADLEYLMTMEGALSGGLADTLSAVNNGEAQKTKSAGMFNLAVSANYLF